MLNEPTLEKLHTMRMSTMAESWLEQQRDPEMDGLNFDERLGMLVDAEYIARENRKLHRRLREAKLRIPQACMEDIHYAARRGLDKPQMRQLGTCKWLSESLNVVVTGATGVGKTFIACAFGQQACRRGYRTMYRRVTRLLDELVLARADGTYPQLLSRFARMDLLILDDWGMGTLTETQRHDLLEVLEDRDGDRSTLVASQLPPEKWHEQIGDPTVADAILDRLIHRAYKIGLKGPSRRKPKKETGTKKTQ
jgi:DNA replication protein DnaC